MCDVHVALCLNVLSVYMYVRCTRDTVFECVECVYVCANVKEDV